MRLDLALLERGLVTTRSKAQDLIRHEKVTVGGKPATKCGQDVLETDEILLLEEESPFVSRAGDKLNGFLKTTNFKVDGMRVLDVGISTGGFCQCLLQYGAREVVGVDVGSNQLAFELRHNPKVVLIEKTDFRNWNPEQTLLPFDLIVADVSFISLELILPHLGKYLPVGGHGFVLVKPQFEVGKSALNKTGIVKDVHLQLRAVEKISALARQLGFEVSEILPSSVKGGDGNQEYFLWITKTSRD